MAPALTWGTAAASCAWRLDRRDRAGTRVAFGGMFVDDAFARFAKVVILLSAAASC
jgi:NADH-quinone oxidoreductase subunit N